MIVGIIGCGYVGLVTALGLATMGRKVFCVEINEEKIQSLEKGIVPFYEPQTEDVLKESMESGRLSFFRDIKDFPEIPKLIIVAVGTPPSCTGEADLNQLNASCSMIGQYIGEANQIISIVIKSTVPPGTTSTKVKHWIERYSGLKHGSFGLGMVPEFLREGSALDDFVCADRLVIGSEDEYTADLCERIFGNSKGEVIHTNTKTAEFGKYANNILLANLVTVNNEMARLCRALCDIDYSRVIDIVAADHRWNPIQSNGERLDPAVLKYFYPGPGFGGSCFPKDLSAFCKLAESLNVEVPTVNSVLTSNSAQARLGITILERELGSLTDKTILLLGISFKPHTDDVRNSPAIRILEELSTIGATLLVHDPVSEGSFRSNSSELSSRIGFVQDWKECVLRVDAVVLVTPWPEYAALETLPLSNVLLFDTRDFLNTSTCARRVTMSQGIGVKKIVN